ncbi:MAG: hypothetical protein CMF59_16765 [Leptospiraceae bacterium]|nr:hypothetical protein [Leptospiraceae bacterium]
MSKVEKASWGSVPLAVIPHLTNRELLVYAALSMRQGKKDQSWHGLESLSETILECSGVELKPRRISQLCQSIQAKGFITIKRRYRQSNIYTVHSESLKSANLGKPANTISRPRVAKHDSRPRVAKEENNNTTTIIKTKGEAPKNGGSGEAEEVRRNHSKKFRHDKRPDPGYDFRDSGEYQDRGDAVAGLVREREPGGTTGKDDGTAGTTEQAPAKHRYDLSLCGQLVAEGRAREKARREGRVA